MKKKLLAALCAVALVLGLLLQADAAKGDWDDNVMFLAVNDVPMPLTDGAMPIRIGGTIYVPYTVFDTNQNGGARLGIFYGGQNKANNTLTLFNSESKNLTFDLKTGLSYDYIPGGQPQTPTAVIRNGQIYLSASSTCSYFGINCVQTNISVSAGKSYPFIRIRIEEESVMLSDSAFRSNYTTAYVVQLQNYYRSVMGQTGDVGGEPPAVPPTPSATTPPEEQNRRGVRVYLALRCGSGTAGDEMLDTLRAHGGGALLLFPVDSLSGQDDLIRRAVGEGHMVGLVTGATEVELARAELERGNQLLSHIARASTRIVMAEDPAVAGALESEGWLCWRESISALPNGRGSATVYTQVYQKLESSERTARVTLDDSETSSTVLSRLLRTLREESYDLRMAVETEF